jgi:DnaJ-class molecular chaperone
LIGTSESRAKFDRGDFDDEVRGHSEEPSKQGRGPFYNQTQQGGGRYSYSFGGMDDETLEAIFGRMGRGESFESTGDSRGQDILYRMDVEFTDAVLGAERDITLPSGKRLRVKIPPGVDSGVKLRFAGQGSPGTGKMHNGDAYVELQIKSSPLFKRMGSDLEVELPISFNEALLGGDVKVPTIDGSVILKIPPGVSTGMRLRVAGKGISGTSKRGGQYVVLKVVIPPNVDSDFKQAIESWSKRHSIRRM